MKRFLSSLLLAILLSGPAFADCYADYKAKRDNPLRLHYGVIELPEAACSTDAARSEIDSRIGRDGWQLLTVVSVFDENGLNQRREAAGDFFLRY
ncbi:MAG: hypothetical protein HUJ27_15760 [Rhodobacteraceae bacterium]|nr:hypothetical protein [Paracoccaceae bacterium]